MNDTREVLRCTHCQLNQFRTVSGNCRRCHRPYFTPQPVPVKPWVIRREPIHFGALVRVFREARGYTKVKLARRMGCVRTFMTKIEHGDCDPTAETIFRLAEALEIPASALVYCYEVARH